MLQNSPIENFVGVVLCSILPQRKDHTQGGGVKREGGTENRGKGREVGGYEREAKREGVGGGKES